MPAKSNWTLTLYGSATDHATTGNDPTYGMPYLATPAGLASKTIYILKPQFDWSFETETIEDISGTRLGYPNKRGAFNVESYPFKYDATALTLEQDLDDANALADISSDYRYLFARIDGGSRSFPASGYVYPVTIAAWGSSINAQYGTRILAITLEHRKRS